LKLLELETWPPGAPKVPIFAIFEADLQKYINRFYYSGPTVYLDFRLPWPAKFAVGFSCPGKRGPFEKYLPVTWNAPNFDRTYLGFPSIKLNGIFTKTKDLYLYLPL
jgi:hypothetical protein